MLMIAAALFVLPTASAAQRGGGGRGGGMQAWQNEAVADLEQMRDKFLSLAEAFPEDTWDWAPMEGTRSVRDVMVLMVAEGHIFPGMWGASPPTGAADGFGAEIARVTAMSKADVIQEMERALNYMIESVRSMTGPERVAEASWFGTATNGVGVVMHAIVDMHEHLGQSIAYARMNQIVPPWSM
jgi:hypothetical protein